MTTDFDIDYICLDNTKVQPSIIFYYASFHEEQHVKEFALQTYCGEKGWFSAYVLVPSDLHIDYLSEEGMSKLFKTDVTYHEDSAPSGLHIFGFECYGWDYMHEEMDKVTLDDVTRDMESIARRIRDYYHV